MKTLNFNANDRLHIHCLAQTHTFYTCIFILEIILSIILPSSIANIPSNFFICKKKKEIYHSIGPFFL